MSPSDSFRVEQIERIFVVTLGADYENLDGPLVKQAESQMLQVAENNECQALLIDMSYTRFFGSAFIESLIRVWNSLKNRSGSKMKSCGLQPYCLEVLEITHLDQIWGVYDTRDAAMENLQSV